MGTPPSQPTTIHIIGAFIRGFTAGIVVGPLSLFIGVGFGGLFCLLNLVAGAALFLVFTTLAAFIGAASFARRSSESVRSLPLAFAIGIGVAPLCVSPILLSTTTPIPVHFIFPPLFAVGLVLAIGGYYGCTRSQDPETEAQYGVGDTCAACSYDLSATAEGNPCPECGGMMRYPTKTPAEG
jgi:hypothetical protein